MVLRRTSENNNSFENKLMEKLNLYEMQGLLVDAEWNPTVGIEAIQSNDIDSIPEKIKNKDNFIEGEIYTNILENTEENDNNKKESESKQKIIVYITGEINNPGIYEIEENSRIADCIEKAGGTKQNADITDINLAEVLEDGEKIHIPSKG